MFVCKPNKDIIQKAYANMGFKEIMLGRVFVKDN